MMSWSKPLQRHELLVDAVLEADQGLGVVAALGRADFDEQSVHGGLVCGLRRRGASDILRVVVRWHIVIALSGCGASGSSPQPEPPAELELVAPSGVEVCKGTRAWADAEAQRVQDTTGLPLRYALPVELGATAVDESCGEAPVEGVRLGCATGTKGSTKVFAEPVAFAHELTHALRRQWGLSTVPIFEEGYAEAINGSDAYPSYVEREPGDEEVDIAALVLAGEPTVGAGQYRVATHFMRWLMAEHGEAHVAAFMTAGSDATPEGRGGTVRHRVRRIAGGGGRALGEGRERPGLPRRCLPGCDRVRTTADDDRGVDPMRRRGHRGLGRQRRGRVGSAMLSAARNARG